MKYVIPLLLLGLPVHAASVIPNFTRGTVSTETTSRTEVTEIIKQVEYSTGTSYTVTGTNINIPSNPKMGESYTMVTPGAPFQFSETILGPGISSETSIERTTIIDSFSTSISVFTQ